MARTYCRACNVTHEDWEKHRCKLPGLEASRDDEIAWLRSRIEALEAEIIKLVTPPKMLPYAPPQFPGPAYPSWPTITCGDTFEIRGA